MDNRTIPGVAVVAAGCVSLAVGVSEGVGAQGPGVAVVTGVGVAMLLLLPFPGGLNVGAAGTLVGQGVGPGCALLGWLNITISSGVKHTATQKISL
jgi:hypothetical protein